MHTTNNPSSPSIAPLTFVPVMDRRHFASLVGVSERVVDGWIARGYVQTVRFTNGDTYSRTSLINISALTNDCLQAASIETK